MDDGYWENCWKNDGKKEEAVPLNDSLDEDFQTASTWMFGATTKILPQMLELFLPQQTKEEHYDDDTTLWEIIRHIYSKVNIT